MVLFEESVKNLLTDDAKIGTFISARLLSDNDPTVPARSDKAHDLADDLFAAVVILCFLRHGQEALVLCLGEQLASLAQ